MELFCKFFYLSIVFVMSIIHPLNSMKSVLKWTFFLILFSCSISAIGSFMSVAKSDYGSILFGLLKFPFGNSLHEKYLSRLAYILPIGTILITIIAYLNPQKQPSTPSSNQLPIITMTTAIMQAVSAKQLKI
ncbi:hypothetical protein CAEBREN_18435 [Caenorhabditis brenneri]|uniref:Uncharacterized protein n=1 Tax=Caenorhabditis brenneri TaxID=135651 RepID=G0MT77_CAEBE|nr:hypothetical protein CAEBREN_18435 [Caenorhabditis brenneri]